MPRQQRTPYIRQKLPTFQATQANNLLWTITSTAGVRLELTLTGPLDGLTVKGVPPLVPQVGAAQPIDCAIISVDPSGLSAVIYIDFDAALEPADLYTLNQPSTAVANAYGGLLSASQQAFPTPFIFANDIFPSFSAYAGNVLDVVFTSAFLPVCIGAGWSVYNATQMISGNFIGWDGAVAKVDFGTPLLPGDQIEFTAADPACKNGFGGTQTANSFVLP